MLTHSPPSTGSCILAAVAVATVRNHVRDCISALQRGWLLQLPATSYRVDCVENSGPHTHWRRRRGSSGDNAAKTRRPLHINATRVRRLTGLSDMPYNRDIQVEVSAARLQHPTLIRGLNGVERLCVSRGRRLRRRSAVTPRHPPRTTYRLSAPDNPAAIGRPRLGRFLPR